MQRYCFVHAADLHLDTPFSGIRAEAPEVAAALRDASLEAWDALVDLCLEREAAFLLLAGDLYDGAERGVRAQRRFRAGLERLREGGTEVFVVHGNHDPCDEGWSAIREFPAGVTLFPSDAVEAVGVERGGERIATIHGRSYATRETLENLSLGYRRGAEPGLHIGLLHCNVGSASGHADYSPCSLADLKRAGMDYWALGHLHQYQLLSEGDPWIVYPGVLQGRSPKPSERGPKGAAVVHVEAGAIAGVEPVFVDRVRFVALEVDVSACHDLEAVVDAIIDAGQRAREEHAGRGLVVRARLTGRCAVSSELSRASTLDELAQTLREDSKGWSPILWWESLRSDARLVLDREELRARDDFVGALLALSDTLLADDDRAADFVAEQIEALQSTRSGVKLPSLLSGELAVALRAAEELALDHLDEPGDFE